MEVFSVFLIHSLLVTVETFRLMDLFRVVSAKLPYCEVILFSLAVSLDHVHIPLTAKFKCIYLYKYRFLFNPVGCCSLLLLASQRSKCPIFD